MVEVYLISWEILQSNRVPRSNPVEPFAMPLSVPAPGRTIQRSVAPWAHPLLDAYEWVKTEASAHDRELVAAVYRARFAPPGPPRTSGLSPSDFELGCAAAITTWILARLHCPEETQLDLTGAENWFFGETAGDQRFSDVGVLTESIRLLQGLSIGESLEEILPYVLEVFDTGPIGTSRAADHTRRNNRQAKRKDGVFYTPSDVADFIVGHVLDSWFGGRSSLESNALPRCLDPACGTGIFLRSVLDHLALREPQVSDLRRLDAVAANSIYGIDISYHAVQSSVFVLVSRCLVYCRQGKCNDIVPWSLWRAIRLNFAVADSTALANLSGSNVRQPKRSQVPRTALANRKRELFPLVPDREQSTPGGAGAQVHLPLEPLGRQDHVPPSVEQLLPNAGAGFDVVVGNPPYSTLSGDGTGGGSRQNAYPPFIRMMWCLGKRNYSASGMVVPLSIAYHTGKQLQHLRTEMGRVPGRWRIASFDRTPDSLFGDDVKTRNAILLLEQDVDSAPSLETTALVRWSSRGREAMLRDIAFTPLRRTITSAVIPKLGSAIEREVYALLYKSKERLGTDWEEPHELPRELHRCERCTVSFGSTAYNWLPAYREPSSSHMPSGTWSAKCHTEVEADLVFAIVSSRLAYWLWRVEGDGFHLPKRFVAGLPLSVSALPASAQAELSDAAQILWKEMVQVPVISVNKGRQSVSYSPHIAPAAVDVIDQALIDGLGLPVEFAHYLKQFERRTIIAGRDDEASANPAIKRLEESL
jgi:SAM-dependent methyltransferase